jgi:hypothetical protein
MVSRLNRETSTLLALSMCTVWIALDLTRSLDRSDPNPHLGSDPPVIDRQVDSIDLHIMRQENKFPFSNLSNTFTNFG